MTARAPTWQEHAESLVRRLIDAGDLSSDAWIDAFRHTPRHVFTPRVIEFTGRDYRVASADVDRGAWLATVYSDESLVVRDQPHGAGHLLPDGAALRVPTSSSTQPGLMGRMLESLDVDDGMSVLEIGTGTGYNAALLARRLDETRVTSVDIDEDLVDTARARLAELGHHPALATCDGAAGYEPNAPYDRIIATAGVPDIPHAWIEQLAPGGRILANLRGDLAAGSLCMLTKRGPGDEVIGPMLPIGGHFMWLRPSSTDPHRSHELTTRWSRSPEIRTRTAWDPAAIPAADESFRFLLQLHLRGARSLDAACAFDQATDDDQPAVTVSANDGSRAVAYTARRPDGHHRVVQSGPRRIWDAVETAHRMFDDLGRPGIDRYGVVANASTEFVWLDADDGWHRWPLPLT